MAYLFNAVLLLCMALWLPVAVLAQCGESTRPGLSCKDIFQARGRTAPNGVYWVWDGGNRVQVYCDMSAGGLQLLMKLSNGVGNKAPMSVWTDGKSSVVVASLQGRCSCQCDHSWNASLTVSQLLTLLMKPIHRCSAPLKPPQASNTCRGSGPAGAAEIVKWRPLRLRSTREAKRRNPCGSMAKVGCTGCSCRWRACYPLHTSCFVCLSSCGSGTTSSNWFSRGFMTTSSWYDLDTASTQVDNFAVSCLRLGVALLLLP